MASPTRPSPPPVPPAAAVSRRPFYTRWWYDPVQRRRVIIATVLALLYGSGFAYRPATRGFPAARRPGQTRVDPPTGRHLPPQTSKVFGATGRRSTPLGIERRGVL